jgi:CubicO group peptidase (beta-lactamase class C family)
VSRKKISSSADGLKIFTVLVVLVLSIATFKLNNSLRVPSIFDGKFYNTIKIPVSAHPKPLPQEISAIPDLQFWTDSAIYNKYLYPDIFLQHSSTTSFLVVKNGKIIFERYMNGVRKGDITQIFSVTKVFVTALLGIAIKDKIIADVDVPVSSFYPSLEKPMFDSLKLQHLCQMTSGLNYDEYGKLLQTIRFYYNQDLRAAIANARFDFKPGEVFMYKSIDTQILGDCISKALGKKTFIEYLHEKIFEPLGMQDSAFFTVDSKLTRVPKYYGGLNITARDLAKFGVMVAGDGVYNGKRIIPRNWLNQCDNESLRSNSKDRYCMGWYYMVDDGDSDVYFAAGFNGQIMLINETTNVVIVRLGIDKGAVNWYPILKKLSEIV